MLFTPAERTFQHSNWGLAVLLLCLGGLTIELSRPSSHLGWALREAHDGLRGQKDATKLRWTTGTLTITEIDIDVMVRTTIGEAANEPDIGKIAVVWVILNRARSNVSWYGGNNVADVALHKATALRSGGRRVTVWQFEPWMSRRDYLWNIPKHGALYQSVRQLVLGCINGTHSDPTDGATHFLEPDIVRSRTGGTLPKWAQGNGRRIGRHVFYKPEQPSI